MGKYDITAYLGPSYHYEPQIFQKTGRETEDLPARFKFREANLLHALDYVYSRKSLPRSLSGGALSAVKSL